jgi:hypothetical protein
MSQVDSTSAHYWISAVESQCRCSCCEGWDTLTHSSSHVACRGASVRRMRALLLALGTAALPCAQQLSEDECPGRRVLLQLQPGVGTFEPDTCR